MTALTRGTRSPDFRIRNLEGRTLVLSELLQSRPRLLAVFYKASCPVCQLTLPFMQRIHDSLSGYEPVVAVSQDDRSETEEFLEEFGLTLPVMLDEDLSATVALELTNVPSMFLIDREMTVEESVVGFDRDDIEKIYRTLGGGAPLFTAADEVPSYRPG